MITISYVIGQLGKGGAERQLYELVKGIDKSNFKPIVICLSQNGIWANRMRDIGVEVIELKRKKHFGRSVKGLTMATFCKNK